MKRKQLICIVLILIIVFLEVEPIWATSISDIKKEQEKTQDELNSKDSEISGIAGEQKVVEDEIKSFEDELVEILVSLSLLEESLMLQEAALKEAEEDLSEAKRIEEEQNKAMKLRIKSIYEQGNTNYLELLVEAKSITDMVNKFDYVEKLYKYDQMLLEKFIEAKEAVVMWQEELEIQKEELESLKHQQEVEQQALESKKAEKESESAIFEGQLQQAKKDAAILKAQIEQQNAQIKKIEEEEAKRLAALNQKSSSSAGKIDPLIITNAKGSALGKEIAQYAVQFLGNPYVFGGTSLTTGADCSGFTFRVYYNFGYSIPRSSTSQRNVGQSVAFADLEPGDLVCYAGHVAMYIGGGKIVHASTPRSGIIIGNVSYRPIITMRRIV